MAEAVIVRLDAFFLEIGWNISGLRTV